jgi:DNA-binding MarR family transcriptional regulator
VELENRRLQTEVLLEFSRIGGLVERRVQAGFDRQGMCITPAQSRVLMILFQARDALSQRVIARRMGIAEVTVGRLVKSMEEGGWVDRSRDPDDRRCWRVQPTRRAHEALPEFIAVSNEVLDLLFGALSITQTRDLHDTLNALRRRVAG